MRAPTRRGVIAPTDPELRLTLAKEGRRRTFEVRPTKRPGRWLVLETGHRSTSRTIGDPGRALTAQQALDIRIRPLINAGWEPDLADENGTKR